MKIKQVEELVGITSKNIRFYEDQGLINPERAENGYREYHQQDIEILKKIKLLRKLDISVEMIKQLFYQNADLTACLEKHILELQKEQASIEHKQILVREMIENTTSVQSIDCDYWLERTEKMEKEGVDFVDVSKIDIHVKKKAGAIGGGVVMIFVALFMLGINIWLSILDPSTPKLFTILFAAISAIIVVAMVVLIIYRIKEIDGGEEDEALKY